MKKSKINQSNSGQALLIILLILAVALTIGLSVISRSITDIRISQQEEESARTFFAAETGIEEALKQGGPVQGQIGTGEIKYNVIANPQGNALTFDFGGEKFAQGEIQTVWLTDTLFGGSIFFPNDGDSTITVCWGDDPNQKSAIETTFLYKEGGNYEIVKGAYDPGTGEDNDFDSAIIGDGCGMTLSFYKQIDFSGFIPAGADLYALRLRLFYNDQDQPLAVKGSDNFPPQGTCYVSTATYTTSGISRKVQQCQFHKTPPGIFDYVLYSETDLKK